MNQNLKQSLKVISESMKLQVFHSDKDSYFGVLACNVKQSVGSKVLKDHTADMGVLSSGIWMICP